MAEENKDIISATDEKSVAMSNESDATTEEKAIQSLFDENKVELPNIDFSGINVTPYDYQKLIESLRQEKDLDVIFNARLGTYNIYGEYVLDKNIRQELLDMPKFIYSTTFDSDNNLTIYGIRATIPVFGDILFELTVAEDEAVFYLVEEVHRQEVNYVEISKEKIDTVPLDPKNKLPIEYIFQMYNIFKESFDTDDEIRFSCDNILVRKIYLSMLAKALLGKEDISGNDVVGQAMELFRQSGDLGLRVLESLAVGLKQHPEINKLPTKEKYDKAVLDLILSCLDKEVTKDDLKDQKTLDLYLGLRNLRYKSIKFHLEKEMLRLDEKFVVKLANKINKDFVKKDKNNLEKDKQYVLSLTSAVMVANNHKSPIKRNKPIGPILKQNKKEYEKNNIVTPHETKEEKILRILSKSEQNKELQNKSQGSSDKKSDKKASSNSKKLTPAKKPQQKKLSTKKPAKKASKSAKKASKKPSKPKVKAQGKKVSVAKPKSNAKAKSKSKSDSKPKSKDKAKDKSKDKAKKKDDLDETRRKNTLLPRMFVFMRPPRFFPHPPRGVHMPPPPRFTPPPPPPRPFKPRETEYFGLHDGGGSFINRSVPHVNAMPDIATHMGRGISSPTGAMSRETPFVPPTGRTISAEKTEKMEFAETIIESKTETSINGRNVKEKSSSFTRGFVKVPPKAPDMENVMPEAEGLIKDPTLGRQFPSSGRNVNITRLGRRMDDHTLNF